MCYERNNTFWPICNIIARLHCQFEIKFLMLQVRSVFTWFGFWWQKSHFCKKRRKYPPSLTVLNFLDGYILKILRELESLGSITIKFKLKYQRMNWRTYKFLWAVDLMIIKNHVRGHIRLFYPFCDNNETPTFTPF